MVKLYWNVTEQVKLISKLKKVVFKNLKIGITGALLTTTFLFINKVNESY